MKNKITLLTCCLILVSTIAYTQKTVEASNIMKDIKAGKSISIKNATISGILDFTYMDEAMEKLPKRKKNSWWNGNSDNTVKKLIDVKISFTNCVFRNDVLAYIPDEDSGYTFTADFEDSVVFSNCNFERKAMFKYSNFESDTDFSGAIFSDDTTFKYAKFLQKSNFYKTKFNEVATFKYAKFSENVSFANAIFKGSGLPPSLPGCFLGSPPSFSKPSTLALISALSGSSANCFWAFLSLVLANATSTLAFLASSLSAGFAVAAGAALALPPSLSNFSSAAFKSAVKPATLSFSSWFS